MYKGHKARLKLYRPYKRIANRYLGNVGFFCRPLFLFEPQTDLKIYIGGRAMPISLSRKTRKRSRKITLERLEDRIVLDAAIAAAIDDQQQQDHHTTDAAAQAGAKTVEQSAQTQNAPTQAASLGADGHTDPVTQIYSQDLSQILVTNAPDVIHGTAGTDSAGGAHDGVHVLVVSSAVQSADQLVQAAADGVLTVLV